ncbi:cGAS-like receptor 1 isoform X2 [Megachile rotundata]|uniref:cGAS-like receptor 1 isoform X2 n=1 Tax=Megachile rotundata TaxID=143995 RepID=UPI003FD410DD
MENTQLKKKFCDDTIFNEINKKFISLQDAEVKRNNVYLFQVISEVIEQMKLMNPLFKNTFKEIIFCGSFYKGTKVGHPNEFDLNIVMELPVIVNQIIYNATQAAYVQIKVEDNLFLFDKKIYHDFPDKSKRLLKKFITKSLLNPDKFREWIEGIISKVISELSTCSCEENNYFANIRLKKSGPAFTLIIDIPEVYDIIYVDLAPVLAFNISLFEGCLKKLDQLQEYRSKIWYAVPLPFKGTNERLFWRMSFCNQEKELLSKYGRMKPVIRQMKKLRDVQNWKSIASYYIETLFLNKLNELSYNLNRIPLTLFFYMMLKELYRACACHEITFFWDETYNLLEKISMIEMVNISSRLNNIIKNIEKNAMKDDFILAKYILTRNELTLLIDVFTSNIDNSSSEEDTENLQQSWSCVVL